MKIIGDLMMGRRSLPYPFFKGGIGARGVNLEKKTENM
jgi:hypothetical protein